MRSVRRELSDNFSSVCGSRRYNASVGITRQRTAALILSLDVRRTAMVPDKYGKGQILMDTDVRVTVSELFGIVRMGRTRENIFWGE